jgi:hypothetical protein
MEWVALAVERLHLGIADFDTLLVGGGCRARFRVALAPHRVEPALRVVLSIKAGRVTHVDSPASPSNLQPQVFAEESLVREICEPSPSPRRGPWLWTRLRGLLARAHRRQQAGSEYLDTLIKLKDGTGNHTFIVNPRGG